MKLNIAFKTPDAVHYALDDLFNYVEEVNDDGDKVIDGMTRDEVESKLEKVITYGENITIEFTISADKFEATVV